MHVTGMPKETSSRKKGDQREGGGEMENSGTGDGDGWRQSRTACMSEHATRAPIALCAHLKTEIHKTTEKF